MQNTTTNKISEFQEIFFIKIYFLNQITPSTCKTFIPNQCKHAQLTSNHKTLQNVIFNNPLSSILANLSKKLKSATTNSYSYLPIPSKNSTNPTHPPPPPLTYNNPPYNKPSHPSQNSYSPPANKPHTQNTSNTPYGSVPHSPGANTSAQSCRYIQRTPGPLPTKPKNQTLPHPYQYSILSRESISCRIKRGSN